MITIVYNDLGQRISKTVDGEKESYIYLDTHEIAVLDSQRVLKEMRIPGLSVHKDLVRPIAIETREGIYAPLHDLQGNIVKLINIHTKEMIRLNHPDPFGQKLSKKPPARKSPTR